MIEKYVFWIVTGICGVGFVGIFFAIQQFIIGITKKFNLLFIRIEEILEKISNLVENDEFKELEIRVRKMERKMDKCPACNNIGNEN